MALPSHLAVITSQNSGAACGAKASGSCLRIGTATTGIAGISATSRKTGKVRQGSRRRWTRESL